MIAPVYRLDRWVFGGRNGPLSTHRSHEQGFDQRILRMWTLWTRPNMANQTIKPEPP
jgi:hypothetical protein